MPRETFERELQRLQGEMLALGSMVEQAIAESVEVLKRRDMEGSRRLIAQDRQINEKRFAIEGDTLVLIATQQPMAGDLRTLAAVLEIATELERIGDYAKGIAKINLMIGEGPLLKPLVDIPLMAEKACSMLHRALDAFVRQDVALARAIPVEDDQVDALYNQVYRELLTFIMADPRNMDQANYLLWAAHNLERAADRVTNICERVIFTATGEMIEMDVEDSGVEGVS
ncbi:MAG TPA: phosphate signaling complex protein PhoU [Anaerolineae bacterium]|nr:phosphate signaling complex protein PhoU [Anaerolineae bacterium]